MVKKGGMPEAEVLGGLEAEDLHAGQVAKGTIFGLIGNMSLKFVSFIYTIYIARAVSQEDVGLFNSALAIISIVTIWKDFGLSTALSRYIPFFQSRGEHGKSRELTKLTYGVNIVMGVLLTAAVWLAAGYIGEAYGNPHLADAIRALAFIVLADNLFKSGQFFMQGMMDIKAMQMLINLQNVLKLIITVALVQTLGPSLWAICFAYAFSYLAAALLTLPSVIRDYGKMPAGKGIAITQLVAEIAPFGLMLTVLQTFNILISQMDKALLEYFLPRAAADAQVAVYSIAASFGTTILIFPGTVGTIFLPMISKLIGANDIAGARKVVAMSQRWVLLITVPFAAVMMAYSTEMLGMLFGTKYAEGGMTLSIFLFGLLLSISTYTFALALAAMRMVSLELKIAIVVAAVNIALNIALIPVFGIEGAAIASAVSFTLSAALFTYFAGRIIGIGIIPQTLGIVIAGAAALVFAIACKIPVAAAAAMIPDIGNAAMQPYFFKLAYLAIIGFVAALAIAVFGICAVALKCLGREDIGVMRKIARRSNVPGWIAARVEKVMAYGVPKA